MINVTKTFLPPKNEFQDLLDGVWETGWLTNRGVLVKELEAKLKSHLQAPHIICTTNGTLPLQIAIKALELKGEIITSPFSYCATTSSIVWEGCKPIFVDIHPEYLTIDETKIEAATDHIILPVSHTGMLVDKTVAAQTKHFLQHGQFDHSELKHL